MENYLLSCTNKKIWTFYHEHPNLDFETMNLLFTDIMTNLLKDVNSSLSHNIANQLLESMKEIQSKMTQVTDNFNKIENQLLIRFTEFKKDYMEDVKLVLSNNTNQTTDKVLTLVKEYNASLVDKMMVSMNELLPKNNDSLSKQLRENIQQFHSSINEDTHQLLKSSITKSNLDEFVVTIDQKFTHALSHSQTLLNSLITSTEQRIDNRISDLKTSTERNIHDIKEISTANQNSQLYLQTNVNELLKKMEGSSVKGKISENVLFHILNQLYPSSQIESVGTQKETGDIILIRPDRPKILVENKNYNRNVIQEEVKKFIRDVEIQNCCGLFLSQTSGVANKRNFEINIHNGNVLLYVHDVNNDAELIKIAIDVIDNFKMKLDELSVNNESFSIDKMLLDEINKEYQMLITQKLIHIKTLKDFHQKLLKQVEEMNLPSLEHFLSSKYAFSSSKFVCEYCEYVAKNQPSLSAHQRSCKSKLNQENTENPSSSSSLQPPQVQITEIQIPASTASSTSASVPPPILPKKTRTPKNP